MKALTIAIVAGMAILGSLAMACGDDDGNGAGGGGTVVQPGGGGLIAAGQFLTFHEQQFELVHMIQADTVDEGEFAPLGEATASDIEMPGGMQVYERAGDSDAVYTLSPATQDDVAFWLRWRADV